MNYFPRNPPKRTIRGVSNDTDHLSNQIFCKIVSLTQGLSFRSKSNGFMFPKSYFVDATSPKAFASTVGIMKND